MGTSLLVGWLPWTILVLGVAATVYLLGRRERWWWLFVVPLVVILAALSGWIVGGPVSQSIIGQTLLTSDRVWIAVVIAGILLGVGNFFRSTPWRTAIAIVCVVVVTAAAGNQINKSFAQYPTLGDLAGVTAGNQIDGPPTVDAGRTYDALPAGPLTATWTPTGPNIPADGKGVVSDITLPGTTSGFAARPGKVYYPPAYFADNPQPLPVLILMAGQPGNPGDWLSGERVQNIFDPFAAQHRGIAPVVVVVDQLGGDGLGNPMCFDSALGKVDTYLSQDVPHQITTQLRVTTDHSKWAIGGFSNGGTCSFQMVTNHPDVYPSFIDIGGEIEPTIGGHQQSVAAAFGGDEAKFAAVNPMDLLKTRKYPGVAGWFIFGADDVYNTGGPALQSAAQNAGMDTQLWLSPGNGHDWNTVVDGMNHTLPWLAKRTGLTD